MMKLIILIMVLLTPFSSFSATYLHASDWLEEKYESSVRAVINNADELEDYKGEPILFDGLSGITMKNEKLHSSYDDSVFKRVVGRLEKCDGLADTCVIKDGYFKFYLPKDFDFNSQRKWTWGTCQYAATAKIKGKILGVQVDQVHVNAICSDFMFELIEFDIDQNRGITRFELSAEGIKLSYILASEMGFFAKDLQGNYHF